MSSDRFEDETLEEEHFVRGFMVTEGRTRASGVELDPAALIAVSPSGAQAVLSFEDRDIRDYLLSLDAKQCSIAEVSANLHMGLRSAIVLISEMVEANVLTSATTINSKDITVTTLLRLREAISSL